MPHIVLLGDSVFDNQSYVPPGRATIDALMEQAPSGWDVTLLAQDGSTIDEIGRQLLHLPSDATHVIVSTGGNDALRDVGILTEQAGTVAEALWKLGQVISRFEHRYVAMLRKVRARTPQALVCTIYNANFGDTHLQLITGTALAVFNDVIIRAAWAAACPIIELRTVCDEPEDYANQIEPSARGSDKIAAAVLRALRA
jgi:hypothetical protein